MRPPGTRFTVDGERVAGVGRARHRVASARPARRRSSPGTCRTARPRTRTSARARRDLEHERPGVGGLVDDVDHRQLVILVVGQHRWIPESAGSTAMITLLSSFASVVLNSCRGARVREGRRASGGRCGRCRPRSGSATSPRGGGPTRRSARSSIGACAPRPTPRCNIWSESRPWHGTYAEIHADALPAGHRARRRRARAGRRRRVPAAELARSGRRVLRPRDGRLRARADRAHLRPEGGALHPRPEPARAPTSRPTATATSTTSTSSTAPGPASCPISSCTSSSASAATRAPRARVRARRVGRRRRGRARRPAIARRRSRRRVRARVHVGHDERPQGRDAHPPHAAGRAACTCGRGSRPGSPNLMGSPVTHATGMLGAVLAPMDAGPGHPPHRPLGPGARPRRSCSKPTSAPAPARRCSSRASSTIPTSRPSTRAASAASGSGGAPVPLALGERAAAHGIAIVRAYGSTEHPSVTGCSFDDPADKRHGTDGRADDRRRDPAGRRRRRAGRAGRGRRDLVARSRSVRRLHRSRAHRRRVRRRRLVPQRRHGRRSTPTASSRSPTG